MNKYSLFYLLTLIFLSISTHSKKVRNQIIVKCPTRYLENFSNGHNGSKNIFPPKESSFKGTLFNSQVIKEKERVFINCEYRGFVKELNNNLEDKKLIRSQLFRKCQRKQSIHHYNCI